MITKESKYKDLKKWFLDRMDTLPTTLKTNFKTYHDVKQIVKVTIDQTEDLVKSGNVSMNNYHLLKVHRNRLFELYNDLKEYHGTI